MSFSETKENTLSIYHLQKWKWTLQFSEYFNIMRSSQCHKSPHIAVTTTLAKPRLWKSSQNPSEKVQPKPSNGLILSPFGVKSERIIFHEELNHLPDLSLFSILATCLNKKSNRDMVETFNSTFNPWFWFPALHWFDFSSNMNKHKSPLNSMTFTLD